MANIFENMPRQHTFELNANDYGISTYMISKINYVLG